MKEALNIFNDNFHIFKLGVSYNKRFFITNLIDMFFGNILVFINLLSPGLMINFIIEGNWELVVRLLFFVLVINLLSSIWSYFFSCYSAISQEQINIQVIRDFLQKSFKLKLEFFEDKAEYERYTLIFDTCVGIIHKAQGIFISLISGLIKVIISASLLIWVDIWLVLIMMLVVVFNLGIYKKIKKIKYIQQVDLSKKNMGINFIYRLFYMPQFIRDIKTNSLEKIIFKKKNEMTTDIINVVKHSTRSMAKFNFLAACLANIETLIMTLYFANKAFVGTLAIGDFYVAINPYATLKKSIESIFSLRNELYENKLYINNYLTFMNEGGKIYESENDSDAEKLDEIESIEFKNVYYKYLNSTNFSLQNISLSIKKGEKIAITGHNGAGKTTLIKLLLRLYEPSSGNIHLNGNNIKFYDLDSVRTQIAVLFQDYAIYPFTIYDNITLGSDVQDDEMLKALRSFNLHDTITQLPLGINTPITSQLMEGGIEFSGGELQKLAIVRTYLRKCNLVIYDEPTSNLDNEITNRFVDEILKEKFTLVMITHNHDILYKFDRVYNLKDGKLMCS